MTEIQNVKIYSTDDPKEILEALKSGVIKNLTDLKFIVLESRIIIWDWFKTDLDLHRKLLAAYFLHSSETKHYGAGFLTVTKDHYENVITLKFTGESSDLGFPKKVEFLNAYEPFKKFLEENSEGKIECVHEYNSKWRMQEYEEKQKMLNEKELQKFKRNNEDLKKSYKFVLAMLAFIVIVGLLYWALF